MIRAGLALGVFLGLAGCRATVPPASVETVGTLAAGPSVRTAPLAHEIEDAAHLSEMARDRDGWMNEAGQARAERDEAAASHLRQVADWSKALRDERHARERAEAALIERNDGCVRCIKCKRCAGSCDCTGGPQTEPECTCYELTGGHQPGCYFNRTAGSAPTKEERP